MNKDIKNVIKRILDSGAYDAEEIQIKIDVFYTFNRIEQEDYEELSTLIAVNKEGRNT